MGGSFLKLCTHPDKLHQGPILSEVIVVHSIGKITPLKITRKVHLLHNQHYN